MGMAGTMSSPDLHKLQRHNVGDGKDIISNLPDSILHYILSLLPTIHTVRTSILAKRWRYLWTNLSAFHFMIYQYKSDQMQKSPNCLLDMVDRLLRYSNHVERLSIAISGITVDADKVSSFITSVVKHKVQDLKLFLDYLNAASTFVLPYSFSASDSLTKLYLDFRFTLSIPSGICFPSLKTLELSRITFANEVSVQRLFSGCPVLQELTLFRCYWTNIKHISVAISTLKMLTITYGYGISCVISNDRRGCTVEIDAENLLSLSCTSCPPVKFVLVNVTSIVDAFVDLEHFCFRPDTLHAANCANEILSGLSSVKSLNLSCNTLECLSYAKDVLHLLPLFHNLTHLYVCMEPNDFISGVLIREVLMDILPKIPKLEVLYIPKGFNLFLDGGDWTLNSLPCCFKSSLKLFCISEFDGDEAEIQMVKFLSENATVLREIKIFCSEYLSDNLEKVADIRNQLQPLGLGKCVIKFQ